MIRSSLQPYSRRIRRAVSLIELLMVVAIILILAGIGLTYYQGALDGAEIRFVMPQVESTIKAIQTAAGYVGAKVEIEFIRGEPTMRIQITKGDPIDPEEIDSRQFNRLRGGNADLFAEELRKLLTKQQGSINLVTNWNLKDAGLLRRNLSFNKYRWPEGADTPRTFTFLPGNEPQGGTVEFGSLLASADLYLEGGRPMWKMD